MTDNVHHMKLSAVCECECDPFDAAYSIERGVYVCRKCGKRRPTFPNATRDTACPLCAGTGRHDGRPCAVCGERGVLW